MPSRVLAGRIEPNVERPEERTFEILDLRDHVLQDRINLMRAGMTILQAYFIAGRPPQNVKPYGRFEQWSKEIREPMIWAGLTDPCQTRESIIATDPERDAALAVFDNWHRAFSMRAITIQELIKAAVGYEYQVAGDDGALKTCQVAGDDDLKTGLLEVAADLKHPNEISARRLAWWCRNRIGRVIGDFKLLRGEKAAGGFMTWQVAQIIRVEAAALETNHKAADTEADTKPVIEKEIRSVLRKGEKQMDIAELSAIETEEEVVFKLKPGGKFTIKGTDPAIAKALARITSRDEVAAVLRERDGEVEPIVEREIATAVPSVEVQKQNYIAWYQQRSTYYHPTEKELELMFSKVEEGDESLPDFARSFTVRKPNGLLIQIDRKGRVSPPSPYTPHAVKAK